ncbi:MAG: glycosyltransferase family 39 protein [Candidatus Levybacteria bacterium]|nr:glycosyltransferase family 39 protein [Candidatus Levybacteria bacterium]
MRRITWLLVLIFVLGFIVRLYRFDNPVADWHAFRQNDTNAVSTIFAREGINLLYPRYFDISNIQSGIDNPKGYRFVELPIYNALQAGLFKLSTVGCQANPPDGCTGLTLEQWGRLISILATLAGAYFVYLLTKKYARSSAGEFATFFYLFLPFSIFYGRTILPDPAMAGSILAGIYFFDRWIEGISNIKKKISKIHIKYQIFFALSILFTGLSFLLKPYAVFFTLPMVYLAWSKFGFDFIKKWQMWLFLALSLAPLVLWRWWIGQFPEGVPASSWLFNGDGIRFRPAFFRWIGYERVTKLILGYVGILLLAISYLPLAKSKNALFFLSFALASALYVSVIATGNVRHDYYQIATIPTISIFAGLGVASLFDILVKRISGIIAGFIIGIIILSSFYFSWMLVRDYFNINDRGMVAAGKRADEILPKDAIIIAPYDGSTTLLNMSARRGWPTFQEPIEKLIERGATHLVIANPTPNDFSGFGTMYKQIASSKEYLILKLK